MKKQTLSKSLIAVMLGAAVVAGCSRDNASDTDANEAGNNVTESMGIDGGGSGGDNRSAATTASQPAGSASEAAGASVGTGGQASAAGGQASATVPGDHDHAVVGRVEASQNRGKSSRPQNGAAGTSGSAGSSGAGGAGQSGAQRPAGEPHGMGVSPGMESIGDGSAPGGVSQMRR